MSDRGRRVIDRHAGLHAPDVGDKVEVATKIARSDHELGGFSRICLQMAVGPIDRENRLGSIERLAEIAKHIGG